MAAKPPSPRELGSTGSSLRSFEDQDELDQLQAEYRDSSMGDRPQSMAASKLLRLLELERKASAHSASSGPASA